jgi:hypothetical protein
MPLDVTLDRDADAAGMVDVIRAAGGILSAVVRTAPQDIDVWHPDGMADASAVAAVGIVELLVHIDDICRGLALSWDPPDAVCAQVLSPLFPDARKGSGTGALFCARPVAPLFPNGQDWTLGAGTTTRKTKDPGPESASVSTGWRNACSRVCHGVCRPRAL